MLTKTDSNIVQILEQRSLEQPQDTAYIFLSDGEAKEIRLTYQELETKAKAIAIELQKLVSPGSRALLVYPYSQSLEFITAFFGCLYAGVVAVPCHPPQNRLTTKEVQTRLLSAEAEIVLTESSLLDKLQTQLSPLADSSLHWLNTDKSDRHEEDSWIQPNIDPDDLAFLQYTSGSTGEPKGVMITHRCLLENQEMLRLAFGHTKASIGVSWLPLFHDMGLIGHVIQPVYIGTSCVMMSPVSFVQKPIRWLQAISKYKATTSGAPNFAYDLLCDRLKDEQIEQLDLSSWEVAFSGAEPVQASTLERFSRKFASCGFKKTAFYPCYGMAEATLMITGGNKAEFPKVKYLDKVALEENQAVAVSSEANATSIVSAGYAWLDGKIAVVDPESLTECNQGEIGEVWFSGSNVGRGYWKLPEKTQQAFKAELNGQSYLRTGDLGFIADGELYITGRMKDVLVFWGLNHYPQHIEETVSQSHPGLKDNCSAAFSVEVEGKPRLVIAQEIERSHRKSLVLAEVVETIRWQVFQQHFIDIYGIVLIKPGRLPKTSSGKVQRSACKQQFLEDNLEVWQQWYLPNVQQSDVTGLWQRYTNPLTYLKMGGAIARGRLRRVFYSLVNKGFLGNG